MPKSPSILVGLEFGTWPYIAGVRWAVVILGGIYCSRRKRTDVDQSMLWSNIQARALLPGTGLRRHRIRPSLGTGLENYQSFPASDYL